MLQLALIKKVKRSPAHLTLPQPGVSQYKAVLAVSEVRPQRQQVSYSSSDQFMSHNCFFSLEEVFMRCQLYVSRGDGTARQGKGAD